MSWRGKAIGGSIGSFLGPWGTLAGAAAGHYLVDRKAPSPEKQALRLLAVTAGALYELASIDGPYAPSEDKAIRAILGEMNRHTGARLPSHEIPFLIDSASRLDRSLTRLAAAARQQPPLARAALTWLWRTAVSDGDETPGEGKAILAFAQQAGLPENEVWNAALPYVRLGHAATSQERQAACAVLGVPYQADAATLKSAYRQLSQKYHPDKHAQLDPDIRALASEKFHQIKNAYDLLNGGGAASCEWLARQAESGRLVAATADADVRCFLCGQKHRLPRNEKIASARCTHCQTLLAFDRPLAEQFAS